MQTGASASCWSSSLPRRLTSAGTPSLSDHYVDGEDSHRSDVPVFDLPTTGAVSQNSTALDGVLADAAATTITTAQSITSAGTPPSSDHRTDGEDGHRSDSLKSTPRHAIVSAFLPL
jgi:hypothetical protein